MRDYTLGKVLSYFRDKYGGNVDINLGSKIIKCKANAIFGNGVLGRIDFLKNNGFTILRLNKDGVSLGRL